MLLLPLLDPSFRNLSMDKDLLVGRGGGGVGRLLVGLLLALLAMP